MSEGTDKAKLVVENYFECQRRGDLVKSLDLMTDDVTWTVPGDWELAGVRDRAALQNMLTELNVFDGGLQFEHQSVTAEDNRVVVFSHVTGKLLDGRIYQNAIVFIFEIEGSLIRSVIEMPDSAKSRAFWIGA